ncbi:MAG TPA: SOS response-associated peptidase [Acidimicrobiales bacterium]|nr:SOS response-associated peptidase [Acidimicrobiales bacterium]
MCGRFSLYEPSERLARTFEVDEVASGEPQARWNVAPSQQIFAVACSRDGATRRFGTLRWGLVPSWAKDPSIGNRLINARAETVASAPSFRSAFERRRCLVPANGFFEWRRDPGPRRARGRPFYARPADGSVLALGGIWEVWHGPGDEVLRTVAIVTTMANPELAAVHDRMPVIVERDDWARWLAPEALEPAAAGALLRPAPGELLELVAVSDLVNDPKNDLPELIEPLD